MKETLVKKPTCERCNLPLKKRQVRFCSNKCKGLAKRNRKYFTCQVCGIKFHLRTSMVIKGGGKYCSHKCSSIGRMNRISRKCAVCGKEFTQKASKSTNYRGFMCSRACYYVNQIGMIQKNNQGKTKLQHYIRRLYEYRQWRSDVFKRDNYTCQSCGVVGGWLEAHHEIRLVQLLDKYNIKTLDQARIESALWDINNGTTYCEPCHKTLHGINKIEMSVKSNGK